MQRYLHVNISNILKKKHTPPCVFGKLCPLLVGVFDLLEESTRDDEDLECLRAIKSPPALRVFARTLLYA